MAIPQTLYTTEVQNLQFIRITDDVRPNKWVDWEVRFDYMGLEYFGTLGACPAYPTLMHDSTIQFIEPN